MTDRRAELIRLTSEFVGFPTINPPGTDLAACQDWIRSTLDAFGIAHETHDSSTVGGPHQVIVGSIGNTGPLMYLHGHYDVVPVFDDAQFVAKEMDGLLTGRGTCDMKGGLVAMLLAAVDHRDAGGSGQLRLVFVPDEETGGANGSERLEELGVITPDDAVGAIVAEPSHPDIWYAARAAFTVEVTVAGRAAHVGLSYTGANALEAAQPVMAELFSMAASVAEHRTDMRIEPEAARASIMLIGGTSGGGANFNIVPDEFRFTIDRRPNPDEDYATVKADLIGRLEALAQDHPISWRVLQDVDPARTPVDSPLIRHTEAAVHEVTGRRAPLSMCPGCLETRVYSKLGIDAVAYGPGPMAVMHAPDEHVPIQNLVDAHAIYRSILQRTLG